MAWNRPNEAAKPAPKKSPGVMRGAIAGLIVVGISVVLFYCFSGSDQVPAEKKIKTVQKSEQKVVEQVQITNSVSRNVPKPIAADMEKKSDVDVSKLPVPENPMATLPGARTRMQRAKAAGRKALFRHQSDVWLSQYVVPGAPSAPPPITKLTQSDFAASLSDPIEMKDDDTPEERELKEGVMQLREDLKDWIAKGGEFDDFMKQLQARQQKEFMYVSEARKMISNTFKDEDIDTAIETWRAVNKKLEDDGLRPIKLPPRVRAGMRKLNMEIPEK